MERHVVDVEFAGQTVQVPAGGYYDRFRMNPDLDEVARDPPAGNIDFFRRIPKQVVPSRVGPVWAPNFYYRSSNAQLLFLAPLSRLRAMLPMPLEPLRAVPGYGLVALTFYSYAVCDNDPYNEASIAVIVRRPGTRGSQGLELLRSMRRRSFHAHVLALPVTTEIARVRGVEGYQLPKWRTQIDLAIGDAVTAGIAAADGTPDLVLRAPLPVLRDVAPQSHMASNIALNLIDGRWHQTVVQWNMLSFAQTLLPKGVELTRAGGPMSQLLDGLGARKLLRMDVVKDAQLVLNMPRPVAALDGV
jgi:hypothetical protein